LGLLILRLIQPTAGKVYFAGRDIFALDRRTLREIRRSMQIVFQDPDSSLNPRKKIGWTVSEPLLLHRLARGKGVVDRVVEALARVGLGSEHLRRFPHELSGGQKQRVAIARALVTNPQFIVFDEPTSALDVSVQAKVLELIRSIRADMDLTYIFISHDLSVVKHLCDDIAVMYLGRIVEKAPTQELFRAPKHPYTQMLLSSIPSSDPHRRRIAK
jgi:ABC-type oligopeptide transport system ATPase subunit